MTWKSRPFNKIDADPLKSKADKQGSDLLSADSSKCPTCGSNIFYEPELSAMLCPSCGNVYSPDTLEPRGSLGVSKEHDYIGDANMSEDDRKRHEIVCNSCGGTLVADENTMSTMCPFCGSPALITRRMSREFKPDYIIPFKVDKDRAESIMNKWLSGRKNMPMGFRKKCRTTHLTALYVPFWLVDCSVNSDISGTGKNGRGMVKDYYEVNSNVKYYVKGVPFDASLKIPNKLMEAAEPYDYSEMVRFESKYLQGFYANKYDQLPTEMVDRIVKRMDRFSRSMADQLSKRYDSYEDRFDKHLTWLSDLSVKYCLLPVWFVTVEFEGEDYQFAVNGQTGEACGRVPVSQSVDVRNKIFRFCTLPWRFFTIPVAGILPWIITTITLDLKVSPFKTFLIIALTVLLVLDIIVLITSFVMNFYCRKITDFGNRVYEQNDYDKDPGLDSYLDTSRLPEREISERLLRHSVLIADENGMIKDEHSIEL
ncbi:MAG: hypothetical protein K5869_06990 [Saccharofermentans sp.]|nr:hypothetical protein [Saccharofermentans sp.]